MYQLIQYFIMAILVKLYSHCVYSPLNGVHCMFIYIGYWTLNIYYIIIISVMWSELLMAYAISCTLWSSVNECHKVECAFTSPV